MEQPETHNFLPKEFEFAHGYCFFLHDALAKIVVDGEQAGIFRHHFELKDSSHVNQMPKSGEELTIWMEENGYEAELSEANRRHICIALLSDFCHFIYEALECSQKGKLTVAFALLRKPLKENLFYFEWLLADTSDFLNRFYAPIIKDKIRALPLPTSLSKNDRIKIIQNALNKSVFGSWIPANFLYELRYDKDCEYGFEQLFQRANHLITTFTAKTEEQNFNFIFSGEEEHISQWQGLYTILPSLLLHSLMVIQSVIRDFDNGKLQDLNFLNLRAAIGYSLYIQSSTWNTNPQPILDTLLAAITHTEIICLGCQSAILLEEESLDELYSEGLMVCKSCGYKTLLTSDIRLILLGHLIQGKINCPNCNKIIAGTEENLDLCLNSKKIICQGCNEEIDLITNENKQDT